MTEPSTRIAASRGDEALPRACNKGSHLTHGCMAVFRPCARVRRGCAGGVGHAVPPLVEGAPRTLAGGAA